MVFNAFDDEVELVKVGEIVQALGNMTVGDVFGLAMAYCQGQRDKTLFDFILEVCDTK